MKHILLIAFLSPILALGQVITPVDLDPPSDTPRQGFQKLNTNDANIKARLDSIVNAGLGGGATTVPFDSITDLPTTLSGYGITDAWGTSGTTTLTGSTVVTGSSIAFESSVEFNSNPSIRRYGSVPTIEVFRGNGTKVSPTGVLSGGSMQIRFGGYNGSAFSYGALINAFANQNWSSSAMGMDMSFTVKEANTTTDVANFHILGTAGNAGSVVIGPYGAANARLHIRKNNNYPSVNLFTVGDSQNTNLYLTVDSTGNTILSKAARYIGDLSATFTDSSLVTKAYVLDAIADGGGSVSFSGITGSPSENANLDAALDAKQDVLTGLTSSVAELNILDGVTATASELNALDGITSTVTELNYTDGVTSAIQPQLNSKTTTALTASTGSAIAFDIPRRYGTTASPVTGNITYNSTGAVVGQVQTMIHNDSSEPTWGSEFDIISGTYTTSTNNKIMLFLVESGVVWVTISQ